MDYKIQRFLGKLHLLHQGDVKYFCSKLFLFIYPVRTRLSAELFHIILMMEKEMVSEMLDFLNSFDAAVCPRRVYRIVNNFQFCLADL
jgi:hypothetical protein